jgi:thymidylate kinase
MGTTEMIIVVEGPDGAGKSTLMGELAKHPAINSFTVWHAGGPVRSVVDYQQRIEYIKLHANMIMDRIPCLSELVYCSILGRSLPVPANRLWNDLVRLNPIIVYCSLASSKVMLALMAASKPYKPPEYYAQLREHHAEVCEKYRMLIGEATRARLRVVHANWQVAGNTARTIAAVVNEVEQRKASK